MGRHNRAGQVTKASPMSRNQALASTLPLASGLGLLLARAIIAQGVVGAWPTRVSMPKHAILNHVRNGCVRWQGALPWPPFPSHKWRACERIPIPNRSCAMRRLEETHIQLYSPGAHPKSRTQSSASAWQRASRLDFGWGESCLRSVASARGHREAPSLDTRLSTA